MSRRLDHAPLIGRLLAHGQAPYQFRSNENPSYYVKLLTQRGERVLWGKDLARALAASTTQPKIGDVVGARRVARESVTVIARQRDASGRVVSQNEQLGYRNVWLIEKAGFFAERARLARRVRDEQADVRSTVKAHPELTGTFLTLRGAVELAARRIADPRDRERFVALVREAMASSIVKGEPLPTVRVRDGAQPQTPTSPPIQKKKDEPTR